MNCEQCDDTGLQPIFEHVSFPAHCPGQANVTVEPYDFSRASRYWENDGTVHQLYESYRVCGCAVGQLRVTAQKEKQKASSKKRRGGWGV